MGASALMSSNAQNSTALRIIGRWLRGAITIATDVVSALFTRRHVTSFAVAGQKISACFYYPRADGGTPGVLLLSTATGLTPHEHALAARLARAGFTTLVIAYTKRTTGRAVINNEPRRKQLEQIVVAGWRVLQSDAMVDATRTTVVGLSLGGYFAIYLGAAVKELAPKAVAIYYGMYERAGSELMRLRTPLLLLQGEDDDKDFVTNARRVQELAIRDGKPWEVVFYPSTGHQFDLFESGSPAARNAWERMVAFLRQHLAPAK